MRSDKSFLDRCDWLSHAEELNFSGLCAFDKDMKYRLWNTAMESITGIAAKDLLGESALNAFPFLERNGDHDIYVRPLDGEAGSKFNRPYDISQTGRKGLFDAYYRPLRCGDGQIVGGVLEVRDRAMQLHEALYVQTKLTLAEQQERDQNIARKLGAVIRLRRKGMKLSQEKFALICDMHRTYITEIETGDRNIAVRNLVQIANALAVPTWMLFAEAQL